MKKGVEKRGRDGGDGGGEEGAEKRGQRIVIRNDLLEKQWVIQQKGTWRRRKHENFGMDKSRDQLPRKGVFMLYTKNRAYAEETDGVNDKG